MARPIRLPKIEPGDQWEVNLDSPPSKILTVDYIDLERGRVYYTTGEFDVLLQFNDRVYMRPHKPNGL